MPGSVTPTIETVWWRYLDFAYKSAPRKKTAIEKNSTVSDREFDSLLLTVEFFDLRTFYLGALLYANSC
jgi:hypothetical protein